MYSPEDIHYKLEELERLIRDFDGYELRNLEGFMTQTADTLRVIRRDLAETKSKADGVKAHIDLERNRLTRDAAIRNISKIVKEWGFPLVGLAHGDDVTELAHFLFTGDWLNKSDLESFFDTDLLLTVLFDSGLPLFIVVEISFLIETDDIERADVNAFVLQNITGVYSCGAVIGCDIMPDAAEKINADDTMLLYCIPDREVFGKHG